MAVRDSARATRIMHGIGRFLTVMGAMHFVLAAISLIVFVATRDFGQGLAFVALFCGSGAAWWLIGNAMRRVEI